MSRSGWMRGRAPLLSVTMAAMVHPYLRSLAPHRLRVFSSRGRPLHLDAKRKPPMPASSASYHVAASWLGWELEEMVQDPIFPGFYYLDVEPQHGADCYRYADEQLEYGSEFQIVQDADWSLVIHPLQEQADISCDPAGPDSRGHGLNWFVSNDGLPAFRIELLAGANMQVAVRYEYETYVLSGCETDETGRDKVVQARFEAMEEAACQGRWQDVLFSLTSLQKWGPRPSAKTLGLGIKACTSSQSTDVWQQAMLLLDQMWAAEQPGASPSRQDYASLVQLCRCAGLEKAAVQLESEVAHWGSDEVQFQIVPGFIWNRQVRMLGGIVQNSMSWTLGTPIPAASQPAWILPCTDRAAIEIAQQQQKWEEAGWRVLACEPGLVETLDDKAKLFEYAQRLGICSYMPQRYTSVEGAAYPCMLKPASGQYGEGARIVNGSEDVRCVVGVDCVSIGADWVLQELIPGEYEFSTSLLVWHGQILDSVTMKYQYDGMEYIWPHVREISKELCEVPAKHLQIMAKFLTGYSGICNFNYKRRPDGRLLDNQVLARPCIFEVNPRIGADLAGDVPKPRARAFFDQLAQIGFKKESSQTCVSEVGAICGRLTFVGPTRLCGSIAVL
ncbi:Trim71 [Symbiodinium natans]|uniref:Trim71 protein n=1 Tax=Symbiodinium natans TaxID=878477 RepID=A0A812JW90_9DINO|nr:Trim71 [Symbiodinium natans]